MRGNDDRIGEVIRFGRITSVDLAAGRCTVSCGDVTSAGVRWLERAAGDTRTFSPPTVGEQVLLLAAEGDIAGAIALRGVSQDAYPLPGQTLEEVIVFQDGTRIAYDPDGHRLTIDAGAGEVTVVATGGISIEGDVTITGNVSCSGTITAEGDVTGEGISLAHHRHGGVQAGGAETGEPV